MNSFILRVAVAYLLPLLLAFSLFVLLRGHVAPGGGFAAGLLAASATIFYTIGYSAEGTRRLLRYPPERLIGWGLLMLLVASLWGLLLGEPLLTAQWISLGSAIDVGTPLLFDIGVCLTVAGVVSTIVISLDEE